MSTVDLGKKFLSRPGVSGGACRPFQGKIPSYFSFSVDKRGKFLYDNRRRDIGNHIMGCVV